MNKNYSMVASDKIFATLECNGRVVARLSERNFSSIDEVVRHGSPASRASLWALHGW